MPIAFGFRQHGQREGVSALRRRLTAMGPDRDDRRPVPVRWAWCTPGRGTGASVTGVEPAEAPPGMHAACRLADGTVWVGTVEGVEGETLVLAAWGRREPLRLPLVELVAVEVVGPHSHAAERVVRDRQRRGESALQLQPCEIKSTLHGRRRSGREPCELRALFLLLGLPKAPRRPKGS